MFTSRLRTTGVLLVVMLLISVSTIAQQQRLTVSGTVKDSGGAPLAGVTVVEKGTTVGTTTDGKGAFKLRISKPHAILTFSFIGMETFQISAEDRKLMEVTMKEGGTMIDDVFVTIGYGQARKSSLTGSVSSVGEHIFSDKLVTSIEDALRGQVAGLRVTDTDGQPGADINLRIRGAGSINASNSPLYVVDGLPMEEMNVSPSDVASLEILKDGSSTAIYGSRGSNGVVMITTKKGEKGKTKVNARFEYSVQQPARLVEMMNSYEYAKYQYDKLAVYSPAKNGLPPITWNQTLYNDRFGNFYTMSEYNYYRDYEAYANPANYVPGSKYIYTDWQDAMLSPAPILNASVNVSGGDERGTYSIMGSYYNMEGIVYNTGLDRMNFRANFDRKLSKKVKFGLTASGQYRDQTGTTTGDASGVIINMLSQPPVKALNRDSWIASEGESEIYNNNPFLQAKNITKKNYNTNITSRLYFDFQFTPWLRYLFTGNYMFSESTIKNFYPKDMPQGRSMNGLAQHNISSSSYWLNENLLYFTPKTIFNKLNSNMMLGATIDHRMVKNLNTETRDFALEDLGSDGMHLGLIRSATTTSQIRTRTASFFASAHFDWDNKYLLDGTLRFDGSSRFGKDNKWATFASGAFAWRISEEQFMKHSEVFSNFKWRVLSVGTNGNSGIPALQSLAVMSVANYPLYGSLPVFGLAPDRTSNPNLKWETSLQYDSGLDIGVFKNMLVITADLYYKKTKDLLFEQPVMSNTGYTSRWSNIGAVDNKGLEIAVQGNVSPRKKVKWTTNFNIMFNRSKVVSLGEAPEMIISPGGPASNFAILKVGQSLGNWYGYRTDGVWNTQAEIDVANENTKRLNPNNPDAEYSQLGVNYNSIKPGYIKFVDVNEDGKVNEDDRSVLGNAQPKFTGGWTNTVTYKGFSLNIGLDFRYGGDVFNETSCHLSQLRGANNMLKSAANYWQPTLYDMTTGKVQRQGNESSQIQRPGGQPAMFCMDMNIEDGSYLRLNDISLTYTIPSKTAKLLAMQSIRVFFSVKNAWIWTKYTGYDPDINVARGVYSDLAPGLDWAAYPKTRGYTLGLNITF